MSIDPPTAITLDDRWTEGLPDYLADQRHMGNIAAERVALTARLLSIEERFISTISRAWHANQMTWRALETAYQAVRRNGLPDQPARWRKADLPHRAKLTELAKRESPNGTWFGQHPFVGYDALPGPGIYVVYVLYTEESVPCYVGSTGHFAGRMANHRNVGKQWSYWSAYQCRDREHAYRVEETFLAQYMPSLNRKTSQ